MKFFTMKRSALIFVSNSLPQVPVGYKDNKFPTDLWPEEYHASMEEEEVKGEEVGLAISATLGSWVSSHPVSQVKKQELKEAQYYPLGHTVRLCQSHWWPVTSVLPIPLPTAPQMG